MCLQRGAGEVVVLLQHLVLQGGGHVVEGVGGGGNGIRVLIGHGDGEVRWIAGGDELAWDLLVESENVVWMLWVGVSELLLLGRSCHSGGEELEGFGGGAVGVLLGELAQGTEDGHRFCHLWRG